MCYAGYHVYPLMRSVIDKQYNLEIWIINDCDIFCVWATPLDGIKKNNLYSTRALVIHA